MCDFCGLWHGSARCSAKYARCRLCWQFGHFARVCPRGRISNCRRLERDTGDKPRVTRRSPRNVRRDRQRLVEFIRRKTASQMPYAHMEDRELARLSLNSTTTTRVTEQVTTSDACVQTENSTGEARTFGTQTETTAGSTSADTQTDDVTIEMKRPIIADVSTDTDDLLMPCICERKPHFMDMFSEQLIEYKLKSYNQEGVILNLEAQLKEMKAELAQQQQPDSPLHAATVPHDIFRNAHQLPHHGQTFNNAPPNNDLNNQFNGYYDDPPNNDSNNQFNGYYDDPPYNGFHNQGNGLYQPPPAQGPYMGHMPKRGRKRNKQHTCSFGSVCGFKN